MVDIDPDDDTSRLRRLPYRRDGGGDGMSARLGSPYVPDLAPAPAANRLRLRLGPADSSGELLDGAWWPRSTDASVELPGLVLAIDGIHGEIVSVRVGADGWRPGPPRLRVGLRVISVAYFASQPASLLTALCENGDRINLLVVTPHTAEVDAATAMLRAASTRNLMTTPFRVGIPPRARTEDAMRASDRWDGTTGTSEQVVGWATTA